MESNKLQSFIFPLIWRYLIIHSICPQKWAVPWDASIWSAIGFSAVTDHITVIWPTAALLLCSFIEQNFPVHNRCLYQCIESQMYNNDITECSKCKNCGLHMIYPSKYSFDMIFSAHHNAITPWILNMLQIYESWVDVSTEIFQCFELYMPQENISKIQTNDRTHNDNKISFQHFLCL